MDIGDSINARWYLAFSTVDYLLSALGLTTKDKLAVASNLNKSYERSFAVDDRYSRQVSNKFRKERQVLEELTWPATGSDLMSHDVWAVCKTFAENLEVVRKQLEIYERTGELKTSRMSLAESYVHMHVNRILRSAHAPQEMILYDFLARIYDSQLAKVRMSEQKPSSS